MNLLIRFLAAVATQAGENADALEEAAPTPTVLENTVHFIERIWAGNSVRAWIIAVALAIVTYLLIKVLKDPVAKRLAKLASKSKSHLDDFLLSVVHKTLPVFSFFLAIYIGSLALVLPEKVRSAIASLTIVIVIIQAAVWVHRLASALIAQAITKRRDEDPASASAFGVVGFFVQLVLWTVVVLVSLQNLGVQITALIAGLGVGGIAIALAAQNILGDIFNSVAILMDKPFEVGEFIIVGEHMGTVERIGIKTTRVRSLTGEELVFSNAELVGSRIKNYGRMQERRILFTIGVVYQTPLEKLKVIPQLLREIIELQSNVRFDRTHFKEYGAFSLNFEIVYYVLNRDYAVYMDVQQAINLALYERFEREGIEFAYPTQTLFVEKQEATAP